MNTITALLQEIVQQNYDIQEMKQTLESIQKNLDKDYRITTVLPMILPQMIPRPMDEEDLVDEDSSDGEDITRGRRYSDVLGSDVKESYYRGCQRLAEDTGMNDSGSGSRDRQL